MAVTLEELQELEGLLAEQLRSKQAALGRAQRELAQAQGAHGVVTGLISAASTPGPRIAPGAENGAEVVQSQGQTEE